jgi:hypothetical protein
MGATNREGEGQLHMRMPARTMRRGRLLAAVHGVSRSVMFRSALEDFVDRGLEEAGLTDLPTPKHGTRKTTRPGSSRKESSETGRTTKSKGQGRTPGNPWKPNPSSNSEALQ